MEMEQLLTRLLKEVKEEIRTNQAKTDVNLNLAKWKRDPQIMLSKRGWRLQFTP
jgi:hypothetical protein